MNKKNEYLEKRRVRLAKKDYEDACNRYVQLFCEKQDCEFGGWVGDIVGGIAWVGDITVNLHDIVWDVNSNAPKGLLFEWYYKSLDSPSNATNYFAYTKGIKILSPED